MTHISVWSAGRNRVAVLELDTDDLREKSIGGRCPHDQGKAVHNDSGRNIFCPIVVVARTVRAPPAVLPWMPEFQYVSRPT